MTATGAPTWVVVALAVAVIWAWRQRRAALAATFAAAIAVLCGAVTALAGPTGGPLAAGAPVPAAYRALVNQAGSQCRDVTPALIAAQLSQESGFNPHARSGAGARGIAQFMPATWATWGQGGDVWNPADAIPAQGRFMCALAAAARKGVRAGRLSGDVVPLALAGYNAGFGAVQNAGGVPAIPETTRYVANITALAAHYATRTA
jgi:MYXO-CTERM domain-containing protein